MVDLIIKKAKPKGQTRSSIDRQIESEWGTRTMTDEQRDKSEFLERKVKEKHGADKSQFKQHHIDRVK